MDSKMQKLAEMTSLATADKPARERLSMLFDPDTFVEIDTFVMSNDQQPGIIAGYGCVEGSIVYAYAQDVTVCGGAVNSAHAKKIKKIYDLALKNGCPVVAVYDSNGAKITEGNEMMAAYGEILKSSNNLSGVVPQVAVVLGTCAGVSAILAQSADVVIMSKKAEMFLTAPFVAKANDKCQPDAGTADFAAKNGIASLVCDDDKQALESARKVLSLLPLNNLSTAPLYEYEKSADSDAVLASASTDADAVVKAIADAQSSIELTKDYAKGIKTVLATIAGSCAGIVAVDKKAGELNGAACDKAARFVKMCDAFNVPVVTLVDTDGFELNSCAWIMTGAAKLANAYAEATCPKVNVITGNAIGAAYIALAGSNSNADVTFAWPNAVISALAPETAVEFLAHDKLTGSNAEEIANSRAQLVQEYIDNQAGAFAAAKDGFIENVIDPAATRDVIITALDMLSGKRVSKLPKKHATI